MSNWSDFHYSFPHSDLRIPGNVQGALISVQVVIMMATVALMATVRVSVIDNGHDDDGINEMVLCRRSRQ